MRIDSFMASVALTLGLPASIYCVIEYEIAFIMTGIHASIIMIIGIKTTDRGVEYMLYEAVNAPTRITETIIAGTKKANIHRYIHKSSQHIPPSFRPKLFFISLYGSVAVIG